MLSTYFFLIIYNAESKWYFTRYKTSKGIRQVNYFHKFYNYEEAKLEYKSCSKVQFPIH